MLALLPFSKWFSRAWNGFATRSVRDVAKENPFRAPAPISVHSGRSSRVDLSGCVFLPATLATFNPGHSRLQTGLARAPPLCSLSPACLAGLRRVFVFPASSCARACSFPYRPWSSAAHSFPVAATESVCPSLGSCCWLRSCCLIVFPSPVRSSSSWGLLASLMVRSGPSAHFLAHSGIVAGWSEVLGSCFVPTFALLRLPTDRMYS